MPTDLDQPNPTELLISSTPLLGRAERLRNTDPQKERLLLAAQQLLDRVSRLREGAPPTRRATNDTEH
jgi:hypothetical protein